MVEHIGLEVMTNFTSEGIFEEKWKGIFANLRFNESSGHSRVYYKNYKKLRKKLSGHHLYSVLCPHKCPKNPFSVFWAESFAENGRKREDTFRVLFQSAPCSKSEVRNKFRNRLWPFLCKLARVPLPLLRLNPNEEKKSSGQLFESIMVVVGESARILRLSSILWEVASSRKRRISAEMGPGRLRESAKRGSPRRISDGVILCTTLGLNEI